MSATILLWTLVAVIGIGVVAWFCAWFDSVAERALGAIHIEPGWPEVWK